MARVDRGILDRVGLTRIGDSMTMTRLYCWSKTGCYKLEGRFKKSGQIKPQNHSHNSRIASTIERIGATLFHREARLQSAQIPPQAHKKKHPSTIVSLGAVNTPLDIPAGWMLPVKRNHLDGNNATVQSAFTWAVQLCATSKQAITIYQIGHNFETSHGFARSTWFRRCAIHAPKTPSKKPWQQRSHIRSRSTNCDRRMIRGG